MSSKTRTRKTRTTTTSTTGSARPLRSVPDQPSAMKVRTETEDKLWAALHAHPNSTAADLSAAAKIGKSTAQKILARWAGDDGLSQVPFRLIAGPCSRPPADAPFPRRRSAS